MGELIEISDWQFVPIGKAAAALVGRVENHRRSRNAGGEECAALVRRMGRRKELELQPERSCQHPGCFMA